MSLFSICDVDRVLPRPFDLERALRGIEELSVALQTCELENAHKFATLVTESPQRELFESLFGNSPFLDRCILNEPYFTARICTIPPEELLSELLAEVSELAAAPAYQLMGDLRIARRRLALLTAAADVSGYWSLEQVTGALSSFADSSLSTVVSNLLQQRANAGELDLPDTANPQHGSGYVVLAMGKLGANELNYSSDIDLIVLYDPDVAPYIGHRSIADCYIGLTRALLRNLSERTGDGYVFRTDLRLRPDAGATPLAISVTAAESYYENVGQNWERAALIKARVVAGDNKVGAAFLSRLRPFIWRKHLDFAAIEDIHSIKRQIAAHRGHKEVAVSGHNIKLGRGGIREIEFFAQTQELIAGGREPSLRSPATQDAIGALATAGRITNVAATDLITAYRFLRQIEHRLQMISDEQTHTLPSDPSRLCHLAMFAGFENDSSLTEVALNHLRRVQRHYAALFEHAPPLGGPGNLVFTGAEDDPDTLKTLELLGFKSPETIASSIRRWHHGRYRAFSGARARELLTALIPTILEAMAKTLDPDRALLRFDDFLSRLPFGGPLLALFRTNPELLDLVAEITGSAPHLAEYLGHDPSLLDSVLDSADTLPPLPNLLDELDQRLSLSRDYQDVLDITRRWARERRFQVGVNILLRRSTANESGPSLSNIAEAVLKALLPQVEKEFAKRHGVVPGGAMAIVAMGRLGAREMTPESDLDLIFLYENESHADSSNGDFPLPTSQYFARLSQRLINAMTVLTTDGDLYQIDMRLRPSGDAGPIAAVVDGFEQYQRESAWTWEHLALTRARVVAGPSRLTKRIETLLFEVLSLPRSNPQLLVDVQDMRKRVANDHPASDPWNIKYARGGLVDLEFLSEYLVLKHACNYPKILHTNTDEVLQRLCEAELLSHRTTEELIKTGRLLRDAHALLRLCRSESSDYSGMPEGLMALLARTVRVKDPEAIEKALVDAEEIVRHHYKLIIGE